MYKYTRNNYRRMNPAICNILDINKQKYAKNHIIIKRHFSYANLPPGKPNDNFPYLLLFLSPVVVEIYHYFRN